MSDKDIDYGKAIWELNRAQSELRELSGKGAHSSVRPKPPFCSFCGKGTNEVAGLVRGPTVYICTECVAAAAKLIQSKEF
jgi:hypothetical protein